MSYQPQPTQHLIGRGREPALLNLHDFTGGLNLRADTFQLAQNESPDLLNVDVDPRGGFSLRGGVAPMTLDALPSPVTSLFSFTTVGGGSQVLAGLENFDIYLSTGGNFVDTGINRPGPLCAVTFGENLYIQNGSANAVRWNGDAFTVLDRWWTNNLEDPDGQIGNMPIAKFAVGHHGYMWAANTLEGTDNNANRIRWSHPNKPEAWREDDFIDIDVGKDGDEITGIAASGDHLLVFKWSGVYAIYGYDPSTFQVVQVSDAMGAVDQQAIVTTDDGVYFYSWPDGVFHYNGNKPTWLFGRIFPAVEDGRIGSYLPGSVHLMWTGRRLWVVTPWENDRTVFVYDPTVGKHGAWVRYDLRLSALHDWNPGNGDSRPLAAIASQNRVVFLERPAGVDNFDGTLTPITAYYRTGWLDGGVFASKKRWRRPHVVVRGQPGIDLPVEVFTEFDADNPSKGFDLHLSPQDEGVLEWANGSWGTGLWGTQGPSTESVRGSNLGNSKVIQLEFSSPTVNAPWQVHAITVPNRKRRVR